MQICIIGGGVVGLNIALELAKGTVPMQKGDCPHEIYILEKEKFLGHHTSTRNSEVIHAGFAYPPDSLKAKLCIEGNALTYELLDKLHVPYKRCGKWVIACGKDEEAALSACVENAKRCGAPKLQSFKVSEFYKAEPSACNVTAAVFSKSSGVMDAASYIRALEVKLSSEKNVNIIYPCKVTGIDTVNKAVATDRGEIKYGILINSAGLWSDEVYSFACRNEDFSVCSVYKIIPFKGEYYTWRKGRVNTMIYPVPQRFLPHPNPPLTKGREDATLVSSMGIHTHRNIAGELFVGPSQVKLSHGQKADYSVTTPAKVFAEGLSKFIKDVHEEELEPAYAGNRPKLYKNGQPVGDFQIFREGSMIHLLGIESPALTAAPAIARYVAKMI